MKATLCATALAGLREMIDSKHQYIKENTRDDGDWDVDTAEGISDYNEEIAYLAERLIDSIQEEPMTTRKQYEEHLDSIGAKWAWLGGFDYAVTLAPEGDLGAAVNDNLSKLADAIKAQKTEVDGREDD